MTLDSPFFGEFARAPERGRWMSGKAKRCLRFEHIVVAARTEDARAGASAAAAVQQNCTVGDVAPQDAGAREERPAGWAGEKSGSQVSASSSSPVMCAQVPPDLMEMEAMLAAGSVDGAGEFVAKENQTPRTIAKTLGICAQELVQVVAATWSLQRSAPALPVSSVTHCLGQPPLCPYAGVARVLPQAGCLLPETCVRS